MTQPIDKTQENSSLDIIKLVYKAIFCATLYGLVLTLFLVKYQTVGVVVLVCNILFLVHIVRCAIRATKYSKT